jgi:phosphate uptake regulator
MSGETERPVGSPPAKGVNTNGGSESRGTNAPPPPVAPAARETAISREPGLARGSLDREMREIKDDVLRMGSMVADQIRSALASLVEHDEERATAVIIGDGRVNEVQRHVSLLIAAAIATQAPVARDLRFLLALDHVTYELARIGDHASSVAKQARMLAPNRR